VCIEKKRKIVLFSGTFLFYFLFLLIFLGFVLLGMVYVYFVTLNLTKRGLSGSILPFNFSVDTNVEPPRRLDYLNEDDEFVVTIGEANVPFQKQNRSGVTNGTIDLGTKPTLKDGTPKDDLDLATIEDKLGESWKLI